MVLVGIARIGLHAHQRPRPQPLGSHESRRRLALAGVHEQFNLVAPPRQLRPAHAEPFGEQFDAGFADPGPARGFVGGGRADRQIAPAHLVAGGERGGVDVEQFDMRIVLKNGEEFARDREFHRLSPAHRERAQPRRHHQEIADPAHRAGRQNLRLGGRARKKPDRQQAEIGEACEAQRERLLARPGEPAGAPLRLQLTRRRLVQGAPQQPHVARCGAQAEVGRHGQQRAAQSARAQAHQRDDIGHRQSSDRLRAFGRSLQAAIELKQFGKVVEPGLQRIGIDEIMADRLAHAVEIVEQQANFGLNETRPEQFSGILLNIRRRISLNERVEPERRRPIA